MKIRELSTLEWIDILREYPAKTFFELPAWYQIWAKYLNIKTSTFLIDDDVLLSVLKLKGAKGLIEFWNSGPVGTYSNLQSLSGKLIPDRDIRDILTAAKVSEARLSPYHLSEKIENEETDQYTQIIRLADHVELTSTWSRNHLRQLQKAQNHQYDICIAKTDEWMAYYQLYEDFLSLKGDHASSRYGASLFKLISELPDKYCKLWLAKNEGEIVAGRLVFYQDLHAVEWHAASQNYSSNRGVNQLLIYHIMNDAKRQGMSIYDFNPSGGHDGVEDFKAKYGAESLYCPVIKNQRLIQNLYLRYTKL